MTHSTYQARLIEQYARLLRSISAQLPRVDAQIKECDDEVRLVALLHRRHDLVELRDGARRQLALEQSIASMLLPGVA